MSDFAGSAILCPTHKPCSALADKIHFINPEKPFCGCQQCAHKYYGLVGLGYGLGLGFRVRVRVRVMVSLV